MIPEHQSNKSITLDRASKNSDVVIQSLQGDKPFISRASGRALTPGARLTIIQNNGIGPMIIYLRDTHIALGRSEARKIIVEWKNENKK